MQQARKNQQYERAGILRDRLKALSHIQSKQMVHIPNLTDVDVIAVAMPAGQISGQVFVYRNGSHYGNFAQVVALPDDVTSAEFLQDFMLQHYQDHEPPQTIYISEEIADHALVDEALRQMRRNNRTAPAWK